MTKLSVGMFAKRVEIAVAEQYLGLPSSYSIRFRLLGK